MEINFVTGNNYKFQIAKEVLKDTKIKLIQKKLDVPEIQSLDVIKIASYSAKWAAKKLNEPVAVTDAGYFIESLNGFPGPFLKYTNRWFTADDYLKLMEGKTNRTVVVKGCLAYCKPGKDPVTFESLTKGKIAKEKGKKGETPISEIFVPTGYEGVESEIPREEMINYWSGIEKYWLELASYLKR